MIGVTVLIVFLGFLTPLISSKSCPEPTRPHLTRCDKYFRCVELPSGNLVWIPNQCDTGLIYETALKMCVLPGDDWECTLPGDQSATASDDSNIYGVNNLEYLSEQLGPYPEEGGSEVTISQEPQLQDFGLEDEFSGDGNPEIVTEKIAEEKVGLIPLPISSTTDSELTTHLQRLTQLIDNFHKNKTIPETPVLHPDDLNSFLAHHNIQHQPNSNINSNKLKLPENGKIHPDTLSQILAQQNHLQETDGAMKNPQMMSRVKQKIIPSKADGSTIHLKSAGVSQIPFRPDRYSNSQIVVNRPEGAVLFNVARPKDPILNPQQKPVEPYISENTLKTVLELSKQLVSSNHQVVPPIIYTIPIPYPTSSQMHSESRKGEKNTTKMKDKPEAISVTVKEPISSTPSPQLNYYVDSYGIKYTPHVDSFPLSYSPGINYYPPYPPLTYSVPSSYSNYPVDSQSVGSYNGQGNIYQTHDQPYLSPPTFGATSHYQLYGAPIESGAGGQTQPANYNFGSSSGNNQQIQTSHNWHDDDNRFQQTLPDEDSQSYETDDEDGMN